MDSSNCNTGRRFYLVSLILAGLFLAAPASATYVTNPRLPMQFERVPHGPGNPGGSWSVNINTESRSTSGSHPTRYNKVRVPVSPSSLTKMLKTSVLSPYGLTLTATLLALDYYFDETDDEFKKVIHPGQSGSDAPELTTNECNSCSLGYGSLCWAQTNPDGGYLYHHAHSFPASGNCGTVVFGPDLNNQGAINCGNAVSCSPYGTRQSDVKFGYMTNATRTSYTTSPITQPATPEELMENIPDSVQETVIKDSIENGTWPNDWPELSTATQNISNTYNNYYQGDQTNYDQTVINQGTDAPESSSMELEFPVFCEWASIVCSFIDWMQQEPTPPVHPEIPTVEPQFETWESGIGNTGTCPADVVTAFQGQNLPFKFDNACWAASTLFRPLLLGLALLTSAFIIVGSRVTG